MVGLVIHSAPPSNWPEGIKTVREALGVTLEQLGAAVERSKHHVQQVETGYRLPALELVDRMATYYCCRFEDLRQPAAPARLEEIRAAFLRKQADLAEKRAQELA